MNKIIKFTEIKNTVDLENKTIMQKTFVKLENKIIPCRSECLASVEERLIDENNFITQRGIEIINEHDFDYLYSVQECKLETKHSKKKFYYLLRGLKI